MLMGAKCRLCNHDSSCVQGTARWVTTGVLQGACFRVVSKDGWTAVIDEEHVCMLVSVSPGVSRLKNWTSCDVVVYSATGEGLAPGGDPLDQPPVRHWLTVAAHPAVRDLHV